MIKPYELRFEESEDALTKVLVSVNGPMVSMALLHKYYCNYCDKENCGARVMFQVNFKAFLSKKLGEYLVGDIKSYMDFYTDNIIFKFSVRDGINKEVMEKEINKFMGILWKYVRENGIGDTK